MKVHIHVRGILIVSLALGLTHASANGADFGAITGLVKDGARVPIAGATITAVKQDGATVRSTISNSEGLYSFSDVVSGTWSVTVQADGKSDFTVSSLVVVASLLAHLQSPRTDINPPSRVRRIG